MDTLTDNTPQTTPDETTAVDVRQPDKPRKKRHPLWRRILRWLIVLILVLVLLVVLTVSAVVYLLKPEQLTPLIERYASEYLDADITVGRAELTYWSTWPRLEVQVDSLCIVSRAFDNAPDSVRRALPADADSLLSVDHLHGGVHILNLLAGRIDLYDVCIDGTRANIVVASPEAANYDIVPPTDSKEETSATGPLKLSVDRFRLINTRSLSYTSLPDSLSATLHVSDIDVNGTELPMYDLSLDIEARHSAMRQFAIDRVRVGFDGKVDWSLDDPARVALSGFDATLDMDDERLVDLHGDVTVGDSITINALTVSTRDLDIAGLLTHLPDEYAAMTRGLDTDMRLTMRAELLKPYTLTDSLTIPDMHVDLDIPACRLFYSGARFRRFVLKGSADIDGSDLNRTVVNIDRMLVNGPIIDMQVSGRLRSLLTDPYIDLRLMGRMRFDALPRVLTARLPYRFGGTISTRSHVRMRMSQLTPQRFHRMYVDGLIHLSEFTLADPDSAMTAYIRDARLDFGTSRSLSYGDQNNKSTVDSLLQVSLKVDTLHMQSPGMIVRLRDFNAGLSSLNRSTSSDTASINPFGGRITADLVSVIAVTDSDSIRLRIREFNSNALLRRYKGDTRNPRLDFNVSARRISLRDRLSRISFSHPDFTLSANMREHGKGRLTQSLTDSIATANPTLSDDSIAALVRAERAARRAQRNLQDSIAAEQAAARGEELVDIEIDSELQTLLRRWDIRGQLTSMSGRISTPYIPLKNRLKNIDLEFNTDSIVLNNLYCKMGQSDFTLEGTISNMRRALTSRRRVKQPIHIDLSVASDTINVNELTQALLAGSAMANDSTLTAAAAAKASSVDEDDDIDYTMSDDTVKGPLIIPRNIDATLTVTARKALYSDLIFDNFAGQVLAYDGAINLRQLSASTEAGSVDLSALYSAPDADDMRFGMGMKVHNFKLDRLTTLIPAIDSLMPMMRNFAGNVNADLALTTALYPNMDLNMGSLAALLKIDGDSLVLMDPETFRIASKWLFFKNKERNMIDHLSAEVAIENSMLSLYPFLFNIDRYRLGVMGHNDLDMNLDYHVSVIKSPLPLKFGINIKGTVDDMKFSIGGAKIKENMVVERVQMADTVRVNLVEQFDRLFRRGAAAASVGRLTFDKAPDPDSIPDTPDTQTDGTSHDATKPDEAALPADTAPASTIDMLRMAIRSIPSNK